MEKLETWRGLLKAIPDDQINILSKHSQSWASCAVGEKLGFPCNTRHEIQELMKEKDDELDTLGTHFFHAIEENNKRKAMSILRQIEKYQISDHLRNNIGETLG